MMEAKFRTDKLQNGNCDTTDNFVSPNTTDFKTQTSHPVRFKNTTSWDFIHPQQRMEKCPTPQIPNVPLHSSHEWNVKHKHEINLK